MTDSPRSAAIAIWQAGVDAVRPSALLPPVLTAIQSELATARRILVVGAGKAGAAMSAALENALGPLLGRVEGIVNVPAETVEPLQRIRVHGARPAGSNHPTTEGVAGAEAMLRLFADAGPDDVGICLISGGGSALLPAPVAGVALADKQAITRLLHASGATIQEMNAVRKHLSRIKGGGLPRGFRGRAMHSFIISDVVGDPLDVIASGPTAADPSTYADALEVLNRYRLRDKAPAAVVSHLERGSRGEEPETLKALPPFVFNHVVGNNRVALNAASALAERLGYQVVDLGSFIEGDTSQVAATMAALVRSVQADHQPAGPPVCLLSGGETTVTLNENPGRGGRNQEFALAMLAKLAGRMKSVVILSGGTDGEDGPTDAAGAILDEALASRLERSRVTEALKRHDAWPLLDSVGALLKTGLTRTNVMDLRVILVDG
jgi:hydroxypyruvate reductase/glycerate 2-kinase